MAPQERVDSPLRRPGLPDSRASVLGLELRGLSGWEEEYLERHQFEANTARLCNEILARCCVSPGEDPGPARERVNALLVPERDRELVRLRRMSLGPKVNARVECPVCGQANEAEFSLDLLPLDFEAPPRRLTVPLPEGGQAVLRLPTAGDQEALFEEGPSDEAGKRSRLLAQTIESYPGLEGEADIYFARSLPVGVRRWLESAIEQALPSLDLQMALECSSCGAPVTAPFDVADFFFSN
jgi:endogenous inhibitor of DNA gyrase (YacG/DUF329 family)